MSACVICPTFSSSVISATIEWTRDSRAASGATCAVALGQISAAVAPAANSETERHRSSFAGTARCLINADIRAGLEVIAGAENPLAPIFLKGFEGRRPLHVIGRPVRR